MLQRKRAWPLWNQNLRLVRNTCTPTDPKAPKHCAKDSPTEAAEEKHTGEKKTMKILSNLACRYKEHCSCSSSKGTYSSVTRLHMLYFFHVTDIFKLCRTQSYIIYMSQVEKNIQFAP